MEAQFLFADNSNVANATKTAMTPHSQGRNDSTFAQRQ
jgi:hypothetical protein